VREDPSGAGRLFWRLGTAAGSWPLLSRAVCGQRPLSRRRTPEEREPIALYRVALGQRPLTDNQLLRSPCW